MSDVNKEIEEMAEAMEKSTDTPQESLFKTLRELGAKGIKEKLMAKSEDGTPLLSDEEREVLKDALVEMKKAASPSMDDNYQAKYVRGDVYKDTIIQEDKADDDQDEKLVKPANAKMKHQGDNAPEGIEGQVIKAKKDNDGDEGKEKKMGQKITDAVDEMAEDEAKEEVKDHEKKMHKKGMKKANAAIDNSKDSKTKADDVPCPMDAKDKKKPKVMGKNYNMKKSKEELLEMKKSIETELESEGVEVTPELVKGKMKALLMEEKQSDDDLEKLQSKKDRGDKARPEDLKVEKENKAAQDKVNDMGQGKMKKAMGWADENALLAANTGGRNHHFSVNGYYNAALEKAEKPAEETVKKSQSEKMDVNDLIEKSMDQSREQNITSQLLTVRDQYVKPKFMKSFADNEIAQALGLTEEEAKKILGE